MALILYSPMAIGYSKNLSLATWVMDVHHVLQYDVFMRLDMEKLNARAKINIGLAVGKRRRDGYHPIRSYFARISLHDTINIDIRPANKFSCKIKSNVPYLEGNNVDIMEKCARAFCEGSGHLFDLYIEIEKRIPTRSGFGGGSSDGAEILKALNKYYDCPLGYPCLIDLGAIYLFSCLMQALHMLKGVAMCCIQWIFQMDLEVFCFLCQMRRYQQLVHTISSTSLTMILSLFRKKLNVQSIKRISQTLLSVLYRVICKKLFLICIATFRLSHSRAPALAAM